MVQLSTQKWFQDHASEFSGDLKFSERLAPYSYYKLGGPADVLAAPKTKADLEWLARGIRETETAVFVLGAGSNVLIADAGFRGLVVRSAKLDTRVEAISDKRIYAGASVLISTLLRNAAQQGWGGLEFLAGIPGSMGGVVTMNAGTHLGEAKDRLRHVEVFQLTGKSPGLLSFNDVELKFTYRKNLFLPDGVIVLNTEWEYLDESPVQVRTKIDEVLLRRKSSQPVDLPSCGSVFKNPKSSGLHAWQVIDRLSLRGHRIGGAEFSPKHCNFIVNLGVARAQDVLSLIQLAKSRAQAELGVELEEEVRLVGEFENPPSITPE